MTVTPVVTDAGMPGGGPPAHVQSPRRSRLHPLASFVLIRAVAGVFTLLIASFLIFMAAQALPGNVASAVLGSTATPEQTAAIRTDLHLDEPLLSRYGRWLGDLLSGHLGNSTAALVHGQTVPVWEAIKEPLTNSLVLSAITMIVFVPLAFGLGVLTAVRAGKPEDHAVSMPLMAIGAMPEFLIGTLVIVIFFSWLDWLPPIAQVAPGTSPLDNPKSLVLPILTLLLACLGYSVRLIRATTLQALQEDFVTMARLNGYRERRVVLRYALRNALAPNVQVIATTIRYLVGGVIIVESVFSYPGIGSTLVQAVGLRDLQMMSVIALLLAAVYVVVNLLADVLVTVLVPKLRTAS
ncbi:ABC transporter permease [Streptomyces sp. NBC_00075]|uniref:ABC transporter permease n=1 Tax=Streptomyces sp. NBC_00075 TaxID=2975641 RepID=UPI003244689D